MDKYRAIIFDFGNVLAEFCPEKLTAPYIKDEVARQYVSDVVFDRAYWDRLDDGSITDEEVKKEISARLPDEFCEIACKAYDNWINNLAPIKGMKQLICDIHMSGKKLYLLSNISKRFSETYADVPWIKELFENFDGLVFSGTIGKVKPNRDIFEHLLTEFNLKAEECIFVDDNEMNILAAESVGIDGYLFDGEEKTLRKFLGF